MKKSFLYKSIKAGVSEFYRGDSTFFTQDDNLFFIRENGNAYGLSIIIYDQSYTADGVPYFEIDPGCFFILNELNIFIESLGIKPKKIISNYPTISQFWRLLAYNGESPVYLGQPKSMEEYRIHTENDIPIVCQKLNELFVSDLKRYLGAFDSVDRLDAMLSPHYKEEMIINTNHTAIKLWLLFVAYEMGNPKLKEMLDELVPKIINGLHYKGLEEWRIITHALLDKVGYASSTKIIPLRSMR